MNIVTGRSAQEDPHKAVEEASDGWGESPDVVFVFASTLQEPNAVAEACSRRFSDSVIVGCTTSGELLHGEHTNGTLVLAGLSGDFRWASTLVEGVTDFDEHGAHAVADSLFSQLGCSLENDLDPDRFVCLLFVDGLSLSEERVSAHLADALEGIRVAGGSAGDDLKFAKTMVIEGGRARSNAATVVLVEIGSKASIEVIKHQHYVTTPRTMVVTRADSQVRRVYEIDGFPAATAYAAALGYARDELTDSVSFRHPITFFCDGELYVRSIQRIHDDGSLTFYCALEEGMVLNVGGHEDMVVALQENLRTSEASSHGPGFLLAFNCILRALEAKQQGMNAGLEAVYKGLFPTMAGFDTYGEQLDGLHINQTLVAVVFRDESVAA